MWKKHKYTHHYIRLAAVSSAIVVRSNHLKLKMRPPHVAVHDGRLHHAAVRLDDEAVFAIFGFFPSRRGNDQPVHHRAVVTSVLVQGLYLQDGGESFVIPSNVKRSG